MNGRGSCYIARHDGGGVSKVARIMLKYRPIAPKPVAAGVSTTENSEGYVNCRRGKRKYVKLNGKIKKKSNSKRCNNSEDKKVTPPPEVVTLSLLPETPDREPNSPVTVFADLFSKCNCNNKKSTWLSFDNQGRVDPVVLKPPPPPPPRRLQVVSYVTVECVRDTWVDGERIWCSDAERVMNMEMDTCPGFISDSQDRVVWTNKAFREMAGVGNLIGVEDMSVVLVRKDNWTPSPVTYPTFTCKVRVTSATRSDYRYTAPPPSSPTQTLPCDAWRMESGACAWRLDVKAALSLGR